MSQRRVVVVGAGFGGLGAALSLAARGARVTVLEAGPRAGGKANVSTHDGVEFDTGPSLFTLADVVDGLFREVGTSIRDEVDVLEPSPTFRHLWPDGTVLDFQPRLEDTLDQVRAVLGAEAAGDLAGFVQYSRDIWEAAAPTFVFKDAPSFAGLLKMGPAGMKALTKIDAMRTMQGGIDHRVRHPKLRDILYRFATYNGSDPRRAPATLNCITWVQLGLGSFGVRGGMNALARAIERLAVARGVEFEYGVRVRRIDVRRGKAVGVETEDGRAIPADVVVANADVTHVGNDLLPKTRHGMKLDVEPSTSGWTGVLKARRRTGDEARVAHTVFFPSRYVGEFEDLFDRDRPPEEPTVYLCAQEHAHGRSGWPEHEPVFVMANAPAEPERGARSPEVFERLEAKVLERLRGAGLAGPDDALVWTRTPTELARTYPGTRGTIYGASSNAKMSAFNRPANRVAKVPGLYLASGGAHPGGGVPLCIQSGRVAAKLAAEDLGLRVAA